MPKIISIFPISGMRRNIVFDAASGNLVLPPRGTNRILEQ